MLLFVVSGVFSGAAQAEETPEERYLRERIEQHSFDEPAWGELTRELDYSPFQKRSDEKKSEETESSRSDTDKGRRNPAVRADNPLLANIVKFVIILTTAVGLALLLKHLLGFGVFPRNKRVKAQELNEARLEEVEERLHESDLETLIRQAVEQGRYALAVRLYFLAILKELSLRKAIRWKREKTNREYLRELQDRTDYEDFRQAALLFERVWYGDRTIDRTGFQRVEKQLAGFLQRLQNRTD